MSEPGIAEAPQGANKKKGSWLEQMAPVLNAVQVAILVAGLLVFAAVRIAVDAFYSQLGATPDEVGLSYASTLSRAAVGVVGYALLIGLFSALFWASFVFKLDFLGKLLFGLLFVLFIPLIAEEGGVGLPFGAEKWAWPPIVVPALMVAGALAFWPIADNRGKTGLLILVLISVFWIGVEAQARGRQLAERVVAGSEVLPNPLFTVVPVTASCISLTWTDADSTAPVDTPGAYLYLGAAEGTALLLQPQPKVGAAILHRLPQASMLMTHSVRLGDPVTCWTRSTA